MGLFSSNVVDIKFHLKTRAAFGCQRIFRGPVLYKVSPKDQLVAKNCSGLVVKYNTNILI